LGFARPAVSEREAEGARTKTAGAKYSVGRQRDSAKSEVFQEEFLLGAKKGDDPAEQM
jgi:hypothetical protein